MAELPSTRVWLSRGVFLSLAGAIIYVKLLPFSTTPMGWAPPDLLLALTLAWAARRPDYVPVVAVAGVFLLADLLFHRPPGLWAGLVVIATEMLRARAARLRSAAFMAEWISVSATIIGLMLAYRLAMTVMMLPQAPLFLTISQAVLTILVYPVVVGLSYVLFGLARPARGAVDSLGHRL